MTKQQSSSKIRCIVSVNRHGVHVITTHASRASAIREVFARCEAGHSRIRGRWVSVDTTPETRHNPSPLYEAMHRKPTRSRVQPAQSVPRG